MEKARRKKRISRRESRTICPTARPCGGGQFSAGRDQNQTVRRSEYLRKNDLLYQVGWTGGVALVGTTPKHWRSLKICEPAGECQQHGRSPKSNKSARPTGSKSDKAIVSVECSSTLAATKPTNGSAKHANEAAWKCFHNWRIGRSNLNFHRQPGQSYNLDKTDAQSPHCWYIGCGTTWKRYSGV